MKLRKKKRLIPPSLLDLFLCFFTLSVVEDLTGGVFLIWIDLSGGVFWRGGFCALPESTLGSV